MLCGDLEVSGFRLTTIPGFLWARLHQVHFTSPITATLTMANQIVSLELLPDWII
jgi:hypothetical protein